MRKLRKGTPEKAHLLKTGHSFLQPNSPVKVRDKALIEEARQFVREFKKEYNVCADCDHEYPPFVLEFDHVDPTTKKFNVGDASSVPSMEALHNEIDKCDVVCSNCHKIREFGRKIHEEQKKSRLKMAR